LGAFAEGVVREFYEGQRRRHLRERERLERSGAIGLRGGTAKWNRQELYINRLRMEQAQAASRRHLVARHASWLEGAQRGKGGPSFEALSDIVAMQHFIDVDVEDLSLPEPSRRSEDTFRGDVCDQFLLDAPRSKYYIEGVEMDLSEESRRHSLPQAEFCDRLVDAVQSCLGVGAPPKLLRAVSSSMSQSGVASMERATSSRGEPQVAVSGGDQHTWYSLRAVDEPEGRAWDLEMMVRKTGFEQCIIYPSPLEQPHSSEDPIPSACSSSSAISKSCRIRYRARGADGEVEADVQELTSEIRLLDDRGRPLPVLAGLVSPSADRLRDGPRSPPAAAAALAVYACGLCVGGCGLACRGAVRLVGKACGRLRPHAKVGLKRDDEDRP